MHHVIILYERMYDCCSQANGVFDLDLKIVLQLCVQQVSDMLVFFPVADIPIKEENTAVKQQDFTINVFPSGHGRTWFWIFSYQEL